ncbi:hypothetical protein RAB80_018184 [Fusarium oxysporum f. sp. vasinfectum]|nr:hypothetical protein RAB80_018184 [Fusarium oxysporum f. sp. vasinfectum]
MVPILVFHLVATAMLLVHHTQALEDLDPDDFNKWTKRGPVRKLHNPVVWINRSNKATVILRRLQDDDPDKNYSGQGRLDETPIYYADTVLYPGIQWAFLTRAYSGREGWIDKARYLIQTLWEEKYRDLPAQREIVDSNLPVAVRAREYNPFDSFQDELMSYPNSEEESVADEFERGTGQCAALSQFLSKLPSSGEILITAIIIAAPTLQPEPRVRTWE